LAIFWAGCLVGYGTRRFGHPAWTGFVAGGIGIVLGAWLAFALGLLS
jgi:hypothetical protein